MCVQAGMGTNTYRCSGFESRGSLGGTVAFTFALTACLYTPASFATVVELGTVEVEVEDRSEVFNKTCKHYNPLRRLKV